MTQASSSQIYTVGHQTLDDRRTGFMNYVIEKEENSRINMIHANKIHRKYDPVLQIEERDEDIPNRKKDTTDSNKREKLSEKFHENLHHLHGKF